MQIKPHFRWLCSYRGSADYMITDETGTYRAELRYRADEEDAAIYNGSREEWNRDVVAAVNVLRRYCADKPIAPHVLAAFNQWRADERAKHIAEMKAQPHRYGEIDENDTRLFPPIIPAKTGHYEVGKGWIIAD